MSARPNETAGTPRSGEPDRERQTRTRDESFDAEEFLGSIDKLTRDLKNATVTLSEREVRFLVDAYYAMQRDRIRAAHQNRTLAAGNEPHEILGWLTSQRTQLEKQIARALDAYSDSVYAGQWARSIVGIGPIIAAGLVAHFDITKAPTAGHFWRIAGLDPTSIWLGKDKSEELLLNCLAEHGHGRSKIIPEPVFLLACQRVNINPINMRARLTDEHGKIDMSFAKVSAAFAKRPWNAGLKTLMWKLGESFVKVSNNPNDVYGKVYAQRKLLESQRNGDGLYAEQAAEALRRRRYGADTEARKHYEAGHLPPARIHLRSQRYAVKLFVAHLHHVMYEIHFRSPPPKPYIIQHGGHTHFIAPPNWPMQE